MLTVHHDNLGGAQKLLKVLLGADIDYFGHFEMG
jgi:hypothetical protein